MTKRIRLFYWLGAVIAFLGVGYAGNGALYYAWLTASAPQAWSGDRAAPFVYGFLALAVLSLVAFICCVVVLGRHASRRRRSEVDARRV